MKIVVDIKGELKKNDILIFNGECFRPINKDDFVCKLKQENEQIKTQIDEIKNDLEIFKLGVNGKLENYHNILQTLTKED